MADRTGCRSSRALLLSECLATLLAALRLPHQRVGRPPLNPEVSGLAGLREVGHSTEALLSEAELRAGGVATFPNGEWSVPKSCRTPESHRVSDLDRGYGLPAARSW